MPAELQISGRMQLTQWQKGLAFALIAPLLYALKSVLIKFAPPTRVEFFVFFRFIFDFLLLIPFFILYRNKLHSKQLGLHSIRAIFAAISIACSVYGIKHLALVDAVLLESTLPLFVPLVAWAWYGKKITASSFFILILGFAAVFILLQPKLNVLHLASLASIGAGLCSAITAVSIGKLSTTEHPIAFLFYFNVFSAALTAIPCVCTWESNFPMDSFSFWLPFGLISLCGVLYQYAIIKAYSLIPLHITGNLSYFEVLFGALFGWWIWAEPLSASQIFGGGILIGSGLLMLRRNQQDSAQKTVASSNKESVS